MVYEWIKLNHNDGLTEAELTQHFEKKDIQRMLIRAFLYELQIEKLIEMEQRGNLKIYKVVGK